MFLRETADDFTRDIIMANHGMASQNTEIEKDAREIIDARQELPFIINEKIASELLLANKELRFQIQEKENKAAELILANKELAFQNQEKEKRAAELIIANEELDFQNKEKEKRAAELIIANKELAFQNQEKEKRAAELIVANKELAFQSQEKEKRSQELLTAYTELKKAEEFLHKNVLDLKEIMFITSHKVRAPIANILGISSLLDQYIDSPARLSQLVKYIKESAKSLDAFTKELTTFIAGLKQK
jgi:signal transduction histidine kinase